MARPTKGFEHIQRVQGDAESKRRAAVVMRGLSGHISVDEACRQLGIGRTRFLTWRDRLLQATVASMAPRAVGRPPRSYTHQDLELLRRQIVDLERETAALRRENRILRAQLDLAALPPRSAAQSRGKRPTLLQ